MAQQAAAATEAVRSEVDHMISTTVSTDGAAVRITPCGIPQKVNGIWGDDGCVQWGYPRMKSLVHLSSVNAARINPAVA